MIYYYCLCDQEKITFSKINNKKFPVISSIVYLVNYWFSNTSCRI